MRVFYLLIHFNAESIPHSRLCLRQKDVSKFGNHQDHLFAQLLAILQTVSAPLPRINKSYNAQETIKIFEEYREMS